MTYLRKIQIDQDTPASDAFNRLRTSHPVTIFASKLIGVDDGPIFWDESLESGAGITASTPTADLPYVDFTSTDVTAGKFTRQTFQRFNYQPGKSHLLLCTGVLDLSGGGTGVQRRIGYFDDNNGIFFEDDEGTIKVVVRSKVTGSVVDTKVAQSSWNIDVMDGTGPSGITADWADAQIFVIDLQWLGVGRIRFGLEINGMLYPVHEANLSANIAAVPYMSTPNLPLRFQMITTGSSPVSTMRCICAAVISEGGADDRGIRRRFSTAGTHTSTAVENTLYAVVGLRLGSTHLGTDVELLSASVVLFTASSDLEWVLLHDPTIAGSPSWSAPTDSMCETFKGATANTVTGGREIAGGYLGTGTANSAPGSISQELDSVLKLGAAIDGTRDTFVLAVRAINGGTALDVEGGIAWRERI